MDGPKREIPELGADYADPAARPAYGMRYLLAIPAEPPPAGQLVVHNRVVPTRRLGSRGFRAWIASTEPDPPGRWLGGAHQVIRCDCGWAPELPEHDRSVEAATDRG